MLMAIMVQQILNILPVFLFLFFSFLEGGWEGGAGGSGANLCTLLKKLTLILKSIFAITQRTYITSQWGSLCE